MKRVSKYLEKLREKMVGENLPGLNIEPVLELWLYHVQQKANGCPPLEGIHFRQWNE